MKTVLADHPRSAQILQAVLRDKQRRNPLYSLRAAARDIGVSSGYLSGVINGKKRLTFQRAVQISQFLKIDDAITRNFLKAVAVETNKDPACRAFLEEAISGQGAEQTQEFAVMELDRFRMMSEWYHLAILDLTLVKGFKADPKWVAGELGITIEQVESAVERLRRLGLLEIRGRKWIRTSAKIAVPTTYSDRAMREYQEQMLERAREALQSPEPEDFAARDISGVSMAINPALLPEAKLKIQRFRRHLLEFLGTGECTELYRMNVQLFRLTKKRKRHA